MIQPYDYQKQAINDIYTKFKTFNKVLFQLSTAGGKTIVFSFLSKFWNERYKNKVLILCHREELVEQTIASLNQIGVTCEKITSKTKNLKHSSQCYVAMIETINNRLNKNPYFVKDVGLVICDEAHTLVFDKVFKYFANSKILGCTATPVVLKRVKFWKCKYCKSTHQQQVECCDKETEEWSRPFTLSEIYEEIVLGPSINQLIEMGSLVREISFVKDYVDYDTIKQDADGEFMPDEQYNSDDAVFNVLLNYEQICKGKKTMIFNGSTKTNLIVLDKFLKAGYNARIFDTVNKKESGNRKELIKWFKDTPDAILINSNVFTTGFDVKEVEAIIVNRPTTSLSLWIQIAGRGARATDKIYKDSFILIDGGGNTNRHQEFSDPTRDWRKIFFEGIGKPKAKKQDAFDIESCPNCELLYAKSEPCCPECGFVIEPKPPRDRNATESEEVLMPIRKIPPPNGDKIYKYTKSKNEDVNFAFKIMIEQICDMFKFYRVTKKMYHNTKNNGKLDKKIYQMINKCYFVLISKKDIQAPNNRTISYLKQKTLEKLDKHYGI